MGLVFEWDPEKAETNLRKHRISFQEAVTAFGDPLSVTIRDPDHSVNEQRFILVGQTRMRRLVVVSHAERGRGIRIISARVATRREQKVYEEGE
jgi:uncharacterized protein